MQRTLRLSYINHKHANLHFNVPHSLMYARTQLHRPNVPHHSTVLPQLTFPSQRGIMTQHTATDSTLHHPQQRCVPSLIMARTHWILSSSKVDLEATASIHSSTSTSTTGAFMVAAFREGDSNSTSTRAFHSVYMNLYLLSVHGSVR